jgi:hypothetical protein
MTDKTIAGRDMIDLFKSRYRDRESIEEAVATRTGDGRNRLTGVVLRRLQNGGGGKRF